jgi:inorganic pyrophosphatase
MIGAILLSLAQGAGAWAHPFDLPQPDGFPAEILVVIEIPAGGGVKYEIDPTHGYVTVDRFIQSALRYPGSYGSVPRTIAGDGDPLDVLLIAREPLPPGVAVRVRPIGVLRLLDSGEQDDKVLAVPARDLDPTYAAIGDVSELPEMERRRIGQFFELYEGLTPGQVTELGGLEGRDAALRTLEAAAASYTRERGAAEH